MMISLGNQYNMSDQYVNNIDKVFIWMPVE